MRQRANPITQNIGYFLKNNPETQTTQELGQDIVHITQKMVTLWKNNP